MAVIAQSEQRGRWLKYLTDGRFQGMFDDNRFYTPEPAKKVRVKRGGDKPSLGGT